MKLFAPSELKEKIQKNEKTYKEKRKRKRKQN